MTALLWSAATGSAVATQRAVGFRWPDAAHRRGATAPGVDLPARVLTEVQRLAASGYPISIVDASRRPGGSPALWTPISARETAGNPPLEDWTCGFSTSATRDAAGSGARVRR